MFELNETAACPEHDRRNMQQEAEQQIMENHPPQMKIIKLTTNGNHQLQPQECPIQLVQQSLQHPTYLAPVCNDPEQIMNKKIVFHPTNLNPPIQIITEGKHFPPQIQQILLQGKPIIQGFPRYTTIPASEYNQALVISPIEPGTSLLPAGIEHQKEPQDLSKIIIARSRPDAALMVAGWDHSRILNPQPHTLAKSDIIQPQILSPIQCSYELHQKAIVRPPLSEPTMDWRTRCTLNQDLRCASNQDLRWLPGGMPSSSLQSQESPDSNETSESNDSTNTLNCSQKKKIRCMKANSTQKMKKKLKIPKSYRDIKIVRRGKPKYTYSRSFSKNSNTACSEVSSTIDECAQDGESQSQEYPTDLSSHKHVASVLEESECETASSTTTCSDVPVVSTGNSSPLSESDMNLPLSFSKRLRELKENYLKREELESQCEQSSVQFINEETQTCELWKEDSFSSSEESFEEAESSEMKEDSSLDKEEDEYYEDKMLLQKNIIKPQAPFYTTESAITQEPCGSLSQSKGYEQSKGNQELLRQCEKHQKLDFEKALIDSTEVINNPKPENASIFQGNVESMCDNARTDEVKVIETENENTSDEEEIPLTTNNENVESSQDAQHKTKVDPINWTVNEVCDFIRTVPSCSHYAEKFNLHDVDGRAMMLLDTNHLITMMSMKLGPAVKLMAKIKALQIPSNNQTDK